jgi:putative membrane protein
MTFLTAAGERGLEDAVAAIESVSAAEIVIAIRPRARDFKLQHAFVGAVTAIALLAFTLYSPLEFSLWHILTLPVLAGVFGALLVEAVPPLYRALVPAAVRSEHAHDAACITFVQSGVHATRDRTGILVYIALRERQVELVGDIGVLQKVGIEQLAAWAGALEGVLPRGPEAVGKELAALAPALAKALPRRIDDIDELANTIQQLGAPPRRRRGAA